MNVGRPRTGEPKSRITLVPFAGINLIRFRGSRINGLSRCLTKLNTRHSDKKKPVLLRVDM
ncbi:hypothetical protein M2371_004232 [Buttiauxella sp. BIGb0471]|nr:hypothetical protein [Buttiauxella sp. BIGb0471]BCG11215.1 hypothetical protein BADSM9389_39180 [Buttiauxella agrestis]